MKRLAALLVLPLLACSEKPSGFYSGYAEADYIRLASPAGGSLSSLHVQRGDKVLRDAPAFALEQDNEKAARLAAQARLLRAESVLADLGKGRRPEEVAVIQAQIAQGEAALTLSQAELARQIKLEAAHFLAPARIDEARAALDRDTARLRELRAQVRVAQLGARSDDLAAARAEVKTAEALVAQAEWALNQKTVKFPTAGEVADVLYRPGEVVPPGTPVVSLLAPEHVRARFFVPQTVLGALKLGQGVNLSCDGCAAPIAARISYIAREAEYTAPLIYSKENRATLVFMIEAKPDLAATHGLHPGQPLEIRLAPR